MTEGDRHPATGREHASMDAAPELFPLDWTAPDPVLDRERPEGGER
ncbi:hypothetical protein [Halorarum halobium]|nr:hypothetical protein [Halobaculum sp. XH14]